MATNVQPVRVGANILAGLQGAQDLKANRLAMDTQRQRNALAQEAAQQQRMELNDEQHRAFATKMVQAAQYGIQSPTPKAFIEQNYPQLAELAGPAWATLDDAGVKAKLQEALGIFGPRAGIGPAQEKFGGAQFVNQNGNPVVAQVSDQGNVRVVPGLTPYSNEKGQQPPSGYRWNGQRLEPIPGGPADPNTPNTRDDSRIFAKADKLRDEFNAQSKDFITVNDAYNTVKTLATDHSAAGDLSMIFSFMKMLDPTSVVREQEFANAQNAAGVPDRVVNQYNKLLRGERLNPEQRADFLRQAENLYKTKKGRQDAVSKRYTEMAKRNKVNPDDVVGDLDVSLTTPLPDASNTGAELTATGPNGQKIVLRGGKWVPL